MRDFLKQPAALTQPLPQESSDRLTRAMEREMERNWAEYLRLVELDRERLIRFLDRHFGSCPLGGADVENPESVGQTPEKERNG